MVSSRALIVLLLGFGLSLFACDKQPAPPTQASVPVPTITSSANGLIPGPTIVGKLDVSHAGQPLPTTDFLDVNGRPLRLSKFAGHPILLNLWATWCGPCVLEMPTLDMLAQLEGKRLQVVTISQDIRGPEVVTPWWKAHKLNALQAYTDPQVHMLAALYGGDSSLGALPTTVLYSAAGKEVWRMTGAMDWTSARAQKLLAAAR